MKNTKLVDTFADLAVAITTDVCARSSRKGFDIPDRDIVDSNDIVVSKVGANVLSKVGTKVLSKDERDRYETVDKEYCALE
jgi:hypothetical protein